MTRFSKYCQQFLFTLSMEGQGDKPLVLQNDQLHLKSKRASGYNSPPRTPHQKNQSMGKPPPEMRQKPNRTLRESEALQCFIVASLKGGKPERKMTISSVLPGKQDICQRQAPGFLCRPRGWEGLGCFSTTHGRKPTRGWRGWLLKTQQRWVKKNFRPAPPLILVFLRLAYLNPLPPRG